MKVSRKKKIQGMNLSPIWWIEQPIDIEHKQYILLDYLQKVERSFKSNELHLLHETRYYAKNLECFLTIRSLLELRDFPAPSHEQREYFKTVSSRPDNDPVLIEAVNIAKWSLPKMQEAVKNGSEIFKKIESSLRMYIIGKAISKNTGYLIIRYAGSPVFEAYKFIFDASFKTVSFTLHKYYDMPTKADFLDVKTEILSEENKSDDLFVAVESNLSYDTRKSVFPVLNHLFSQKIYNRNVLGLPT